MVYIYDKIQCHVISDIKLCDLRRKATLFNGHLPTGSYPSICGKWTEVYFMLLLILRVNVIQNGQS